MTVGGFKNIKLFAGDVKITTKKYARDSFGSRISLLYLDVDNYDGTIAILKNLYDKVAKGGLIAFDEYGLKGHGESEAVDEFFKNKRLNYNHYIGPILLQATLSKINMKIYKLADNTIDNHDYFNMINFLKKSNQLTQSKITKKFENNFSNFINLRYSIFVNSGSSANLLIAQTLLEGNI